MLSTVRTVTPPAVPVVSTALVQQHCRIDESYDTDLVSMYVDSATQWAETYLDRALITRTMRWTTAHNHQSFGSGPYGYGYGTGIGYGYGNFLPYTYRPNHGIELPRAPLQAVTEVLISYPEGTNVVLDPSDYYVDPMSEPGRVKIPHRHTLAFHSLSITYTAGYGDDPTTIPTPIVNGILLMAAYLYEHRGDEDSTPPSACERLLWPYRLVSFA